MSGPVSTLLTPENVRTLYALRGWFAASTDGPSLRQLAEACDVSVTSIRPQLLQLKEKGYITVEASNAANNRRQVIRLASDVAS